MNTRLDLEKSDWLEPNSPRFLELVNAAQLNIFKRLYAPMGLMGEPGVNAYVGSSPVVTQAIAPFLRATPITVTASVGKAVLTSSALNAAIAPYETCFVWSIKGKPAGKNCDHIAFKPESQYVIDFSAMLKFFSEERKWYVNWEGYNLVPVRSYDLEVTVARYPLKITNTGQECEFPKFMLDNIATAAALEYSISIRDTAMTARLEQEIMKGI